MFSLRSMFSKIIALAFPLLRSENEAPSYWLLAPYHNTTHGLGKLKNIVAETINVEFSK